MDLLYIAVFMGMNLMRLVVTLHICGIPPGKRKLVFSVLLLTVYDGFAVGNLHILLLLPVSFLVSAAVYFLFFNRSWKHCMFLAAVQLILSVGVVCVSNAICHVAGKIMGQDIASIPVAMLFVLLVWLLLALVAPKINLNWLLELDGSLYKRLIYTNAGMLLVICIGGLILVAINNLDIAVFSACNAFLFLPIIIYHLYTVYQLHCKAREDGLRHTLHVETLEKSFDQLWGFQHDFFNIVSTMKGMAELGEHEKLRKYLEEISNRSTVINNVQSLSGQLRKYPEFYGVLLDKLSKAETNYVNFYPSIRCSDFQPGYISPVDLSRMVGILLDNAFEAALEAEEKVVHYDMEEYLGRVKIRVSNTFQNPVDTEAIYQKDFTTKKNHSGIGLYQVCSIISKYEKKGIALERKTYIDGRYFVQELLI